MISKIISLFTTNIIWKITALILASILWVIAVNIEDPLEIRPFQNVRVGFENMETFERLGLVLLNQDEIERTEVTVRLNASRRLLNQLESADMRAYVDLGAAIFDRVDWVGESIPAPLNLSLPTTAVGNIINDAVQPPTIRLVIDTLDSREFPVSVRKAGAPYDGYISMEPRINPQTVRITGASTVIDSIMHVYTEVDLNDVREDYAVIGRLAVRNENNVDITYRVALEPAEIEVFIPVYRRGQLPVRAPNLVGVLPAGHVITGIQIEPAHINVVGRQEDIEAFGSVILEPIDISGLSSSVTIHRDARDSFIATPLSIQNSHPHDVYISITIEQEEQREFVIPIENIDIFGEFADDYVMELPESLNLRLVGISRIISAIEIDSISLSVNINELTSGTHDVPVSLILPDGVRRADEDVNLRIVISEVIEEPDEDDIYDETV